MKTKKQIKQEIKKTNGLIKSISINHTSYLNDRILKPDVLRQIHRLNEKLNTLYWVLN